jgi:hypothetical protein
MSFVMGLARLSTYVLHTTVSPNWNAESELLGCVDMDSIRKAINENNRDLALKNWEGVRGFIQEYVGNNNNTTLQPDNLVNFEYFTRMIHEKGIEYWFPEDPMEHWSKIGATIQEEPDSVGRFDGNHNGIESFLAKVGQNMLVAAAEEEYGKVVRDGVSI